VYAAVGSYTVSLTASNAAGADTETKSGYITVVAKPGADFWGSPTEGVAPLMVQFNDASRNKPTSWSWDFEGGGTSTEPNPVHEFTSPGFYDISLTVSGTGGSDTQTRVRYIAVGFPDAGLDHWAFRPIIACYDNGIVKGFDDGKYYPEIEVTRDQMAVYISRALAGGDASVPSGPESATFSDVPIDHWAYKYVEYAQAHGIVSGYPGGLYRPTDVVDRGQMAVFIARGLAGGEAGVPSGPATATFPDVTPENEWSWCWKHVEYIAAQEVTKGYPDGKYHPEYACTRDMMAVYIQRAFRLPIS
jgi:PKD repeat protein